MLRLARPGHCDYAVVSNRLCFTPSAFADVSGKVYWLGLCQVPSLGVQRQKAEGPPDLASILGDRRDSIEASKTCTIYNIIQEILKIKTVLSSHII